ncbi:serine hydroxymethyltransferase [Candidatus Uhrbacteria bacterium RIFCSPLOWO2_01_FULL_47_24]|uniref:Serine hydroxymethyltransferase n=1 Tax=Candidatus Uhrbacteria bacterium RIFCSPLOWO2_01_FULL_47_24 TaxID=1802401 RepID=A0A1F7UNQ2_9BACT|nr:MAG: serine hydroxymethyltransferase [Candidatus Uhrbacteria bacterium RIFCSPHIGHO2_01_FULL_47_11]OGL67674.1 MAG: serine hydroxymethyltransferase [Candidatus Uhrbacteria bacterium RIFCSPHIGHO2_02_FULL_46_47]OGL74857.1 MAG: serine hydroxymethyltransferase [Candidatus Uhrbacteria bacterium RIFCSPHIGHO2_12_FULL_47_11]OGL79879.1 MAG: serine hydroxymethyltransferase [Candidatus Uhrbacteria bacterium RIFCSPLOWO2_01_FULL_47_24]OGL84099.1 MAG: serine hydroxymethyltransferase [Candidatus Uhrbacteria 
MTHLSQYDPEIAGAIENELNRQRDGLEMIPSENFVSRAVLEALGSVMTNKYSEGFPGKRYYGGNQFTDVVENLTIERAKTIFRCDHANVQPLSGSPMNQAVYLAFMKPGDTIMGMDLSHGGHLTHGSPVSHMGKLFNFIRYKTHPEEKGRIDFDELMRVAKETKPKIILCGYTSYPRDYDYTDFKKVADEVGAITMADVAHIGGLIAANVMRNPFDYGFDIVTTTTHKTLRGPRGGMILSRGVVSNPLKAPENTRENIPTILDRSVFPGLQGGPHMNQIAATAVCLKEAATPEFHAYAKQVLVNAKSLATALMADGAKLVTDGTDNHMMVIDCVKSWRIPGNEAEKLLDQVGITTNKSLIPDDPNPPFKPSGIRLGTPALTTRGFTEDDMKIIGRTIAEVLKNPQSDDAKSRARTTVRDLTQKHPLYSGLSVL